MKSIGDFGEKRNQMRTNRKEGREMSKVLISVDLNDEGILGRLAKIERLANELQSEIRWAQKEMMHKETADPCEESAGRN